MAVARDKVIIMLAVLAADCASPPPSGPATAANVTSLVGWGPVCSAEQACFPWDGGGISRIVDDAGAEVGVRPISGPFASAFIGQPWGVSSGPNGRTLLVSSNGSLELIDLDAGETGVLAGDGTFQIKDGPASIAKVFAGGPIVQGTDGIYFVDEGPSIRRLNPDGSVTTVAGGSKQGFQDGSALSARFGTVISALWAAPDGGLWIADPINFRIRKLSNGMVSTVAGNGEQAYVDGPSSSASFMNPWAVVGDGTGEFWIGDLTTIRRVDPAGNVTTWVGSTTEAGIVDGPPDVARFEMITALARAPNGNLFVLDTCRIDGEHSEPVSCLRMVDTSGQVTTLAGAHLLDSITGHISNACDGPGITATLNGSALAVDPESPRVFIADPCSDRIRVVTLPESTWGSP